MLRACGDGSTFFARFFIKYTAVPMPTMATTTPLTTPAIKSALEDDDDAEPIIEDDDDAEPTLKDEEIAEYDALEPGYNCWIIVPAL